jgi:hypothetical protein
MNKELKLQPKEFVFVNGYKIHYEKIGKGSSVVLVLPGGFGINSFCFNSYLGSFCFLQAMLEQTVAICWTT